jgi:hypothetical protein
VSRSVQAGLGLFVAVLVYSAAFGGLFGLAFAFAYGRTSGTLTPQALSALMAAAGFVAIYLVPNLKYPANPPAVGSHETIGIRTALYFIMIAVSLTAMIADGHSAPRCTARSKRSGQRCRAPAVEGWRVCRMHGARGGAPEGERNGNYRHGARTKEAIALRKLIRKLGSQ